MAKLLQLGIVYPHEMASGIGHVAVTLGGVNYECRGSRGSLKGSAARGATNKLFKHRFHKVLTNEQAAAAKKWADSCLGLPYVFGGMQNPPPPPVRGGDCSSYISGIIQAAAGKKPMRVFSTGNWKANAARFGFKSGLGGDVVPGRPASAIGVADRPYPGTPVGVDDKRSGHVKWIQARLNFWAKNKHAVLGGRKLPVDGEFGPNTRKAVVAFQKKHGLQGQGMCGAKTWPLLNRIR